MFQTTIAGSLPKPGWLAETDKLWPAWRAEGAGIDIVSNGEQSRQHFVHGFLDFVEGKDVLVGVIDVAKLKALAAGAALARKRYR